MNIAFLLLRNAFLKTMGCLIEQALREGHNCFILYPPPSSPGVKLHQEVLPEALPDFKYGQPRVESCSLESLASLCMNHDVDVLVTHEAYHVLKPAGALSQIEACRRHGVKVVSLSHFYDIAMNPLESLGHFDKTFYLSDFARDLHFRVQLGREPDSQTVSHYKDRQETTGSPMFDQIGKADPAEVRRRFGKPEGRPVVLLIVPTLGYDFWSRTVWRDTTKLKRSYWALRYRRPYYLPEIWLGPSFRDTIEAVRDFCNRSGAFLVVKSRLKLEDPDWLMKIADLYLDGSNEEYYPCFTTYQLLAISNLCVCFGSFTTMESILAGVPVLNVHMNHLDQDRRQLVGLGGLEAPSQKRGELELAIYKRYVRAVHTLEEPSPFNYPGCVYSVDRRKVVSWLKNRTLDDLVIDPEARRTYVEKYTGMNGRPSAQRILTQLTQLVHSPVARATSSSNK